MIKRAIFFIHDELRQLRLLMWVLLVLTFSLWQHCLANLEIKQINPYAKILKILHKEPLRGEAMYNVSIHHRDYVQEMWLPQNVDHFADIADDLSNQTWMMRYYVNSEFYQAGGPIFIMVGGEWEITPSFLHRGHFYDMAQEHSGIMFYTEHRYYGKSWPRSSASTEDLEYLNVLQSLEDLRYFIEYQKSSWSDLHDAKVVLVGCSYSGSMVAWFMKLYPKMAEVAWASSAPLVAKMDFMDYMSYTMKSIKELGGLKCSNKLEDAFQSLRHKLISPSTSHALLRRLKSCQSFNPSNEMDISAFFNSLGNYFAVLVQSYSNWLPIICKSFTSNEIEPLEALVQYIEEIFSPDVEEQQVGQIHGEEWCLDLSYEGMKSIFMQDADIYSGTRCWFYQTCHEFGWFATTQALSNASSSHLFGGQVSLKFFQKLCQDVFQSARGIETVSPHGSTVITFSELNSRAERINHIFGGLMNVSQRVIFTHGLLDPWRAVGLQHGHNVLRLKGYSHVEDFGSINLKDSVEMNVAKLKVAAFINKALRN